MHAQYFSRAISGAQQVQQDTQGKAKFLVVSELLCSVLWFPKEDIKSLKLNLHFFILLQGSCFLKKKNSIGFLNMSRQKQGKHSAVHSFQKLPVLWPTHLTGWWETRACKCTQHCVACLHQRISFMCLNSFECGMLLDRTSKGAVQPSHFPFLLIQLDGFLVSMDFYLWTNKSKKHITYLSRKIYKITQPIHVQM